MSTPEFPVPQVEEALAPYIRSREAALRARQKLTTYVQSKVSNTAGEVQHLHLANPAASLRVKEIPEETPGLRSQYLEALDAYNASVNRRNALQSELDDLQQDHAGSGHPKVMEASLSESVSTYLSLQKQRQFFRKLQIVQSTLAVLMESSPDLTRNDLKAVVQEKLGDTPEPPALTLEVGNEDPQVEKLTFQLKKELVLAKEKLADVTRQRAERQTNGVKAPELQAQVHALRRTRDSLIAWIEQELAKISEESEVTDENSPTKMQAQDLQNSASSYHEQIQQLYEQYVAQRKSCTEVIDTASALISTTTPDTSGKVLPTAVTTAQDGREKKSTIVSNILSYVPAILEMSREDKELFQQNTYLRHQLTASAEDTSNTLKRLADESHLVPPRSYSARTWAAVARDATASTEEFINDHLAEGEKSIGAAKAILEDAHSRNQHFDRVKGTIGR